MEIQSEIKIGGIYRHYKNKLYKVNGIARHSETLEAVVVYECLYTSEMGQSWVRPLSMWSETVEVEGYKGPRFTLVE